MNTTIATIIICLPAWACRLMWNGFASPYSRAGVDWMDGAVWAVDESVLTERILCLVNEWLNCRNTIISVRLSDVLVSAGYRLYVTRRMYTLAHRLESRYGIVLQSS